MNKVVILGSLSTILVALLGSPASAEAQAESPPADAVGAPAAPEDYPRIDVTVAPPQVPVGRTYHMHEGFYLRAAIGIGSVSASFDNQQPGVPNLGGSGFTYNADILAGGTPAPGLVIGGAFLSSFALEASFDGADRDLSTFIVGPFVDGFAEPTGGWHFGGTLGLAQTRVERQAVDLGNNTLRGIGGGVWAGYGAWVSDDFSLGALVRLTGTLGWASRGDVDTSISTFAPTLMFTALYH